METMLKKLKDVHFKTSDTAFKLARTDLSKEIFESLHKTNRTEDVKESLLKKINEAIDDHNIVNSLKVEYALFAKSRL
jgi:hypothetical protein